MNEKELLKNLDEIDRLLSKCINPALRREEHDAIRAVMQVTKHRVTLSFKQEKELSELKKSEEEKEAEEK